MAREVKVHLRLNELCQQVELSAETIIEYVDNGIVEPTGDQPEDWEFDVYVINVVKRAYKLQRDFDIGLSGIPLILDLLDQVKKLRTDNQMLEQRLKRFMVED